MYQLMNKDKEVVSFEKKSKTEFSDNTMFVQTKITGKLPFGYKDINTWIDGRKASKHNSHLQSVMKQLGCDDNEGFIRVTHAASINDTYWIKADGEDVTWNQVSMYRNQFTEVISKLAFEGVGLYDTMSTAADRACTSRHCAKQLMEPTGEHDVVFSSTSPELTCDGSFRKCFRKEPSAGQYNSDIYLYKRGSEVSFGLEPYCEQMASEIANHISPDNTVCYDLVTLHGKTASKCNLFTNETWGYVPFAKVTDTQRYDLQEVFDFYFGIGAEQKFREMLVIDSLCFNQDRHAGNYGVLFNNDTMQIQTMSPVFDFNVSLFPYVSEDEFGNIGDRLFEYSPKLGEDFTRIGQMGMNDTLRDRVKDMEYFSFSFRGDDVFSPRRVEAVEGVVRKQARAVLSKEKLHTKDVFFSQKAKDIQHQKDDSCATIELMHSFLKIADEISFTASTFSSVCEGTGTVQYYLENGSYLMTVDFIKKSISYTDNATIVTSDELKEKNEAFWNDCEKIRKVLMQEKRIGFSIVFDEDNYTETIQYQNSTDRKEELSFEIMGDEEDWEIDL